jgi:hypothetical protein
MKAILKLKNTYQDTQIEKALSRINKFREAQGQETFTGWEVKQKSSKSQIIEPQTVKTSDNAPCSDCGSIFFLRTGTCHVCQTCGASQGCS